LPAISVAIIVTLWWPTWVCLSLYFNFTGKSFTLDDGTYVADTIQIKKFDVAGNLLDIAKINETSDIIIASPILFQTTEVDKLDSSTDTVISCSVSLPGG
jgi:hypothetical protein